MYGFAILYLEGTCLPCSNDVSFPSYTSNSAVNTINALEANLLLLGVGNSLFTPGGVHHCLGVWVHTVPQPQALHGHC